MPRLMPMTRRLRMELFSGALNPTQSWTAPPGVNNVVRMVGKGADGTANTWQTQTLTLASSVASSVGAGQNMVLRADLQNYGAGQANLFGGGTGIRSVTYQPATYITNPSDLTAISINSPITKTVRSTGTISSAGGGLGYFTFSNAGADYYRISIQVDIGGTVGQHTAALGRVFWGGSYGPALVTEYMNTAVVAGTTYEFSIPIGGYVQLYYY